MSLAMSKEDRERFLAELHIGVLAVADGERAPLAVPVWYLYEPGREIRVITGGESRKGKRIRENGRVTLCVQTETMPYRYVTVEGPVVAIEAWEMERDLRPLAHRYLGAEMGERYIEATREEVAGAVLVRIQPERWLSVDYRNQFASL